jgi:putative phage-type endonuclease
MTLTAEQLQKRRQGITATDIAAIVGLNPYRTGLEVYAAKRGQEPERTESEAMWWGSALEPVIAQRYAEQNKCVVARNTKVTVASSTEPWMLCTPDGAVLDNGLGLDVIQGWLPHKTLWGLEFKTAFSHEQVRRWGSGQSAVPEEYFVQCQWSMAVTGLDRWDLAVLLGGYHGLDYREYVLSPNARIIGALKRAGRAFLERVEAGEPPAPDGSASARRALTSLYPRADLNVRLASGDEVALLDAYAVADAEYREAAAAREELQQQIKAAIAGAEGIETPDGLGVTWSVDKRGRRTFRFKGG